MNYHHILYMKTIHIDDLDTGDIILYNGAPNSFFWRIIDRFIKLFTFSNYTHTSFVVCNPTFTHTPLEGTYIWESGWQGTPDPQDQITKCGVQFTSIHKATHNYQGKIYVRKLKPQWKKTNDEWNHYLKPIHTTVYKQPYDINPIHWLEGFFRMSQTIFGNSTETTNCFWCSALVTYILKECGFVNEKVDFTIARPCDLAYNQTDYIIWNGDYYEPEVLLQTN